ncbi:capsid protein [Qinghai Himalayan marmot astrovirus 2]|uniref:capsid protein n=1 Tax=Qinghai Himalayan marmot astrovirus 2 TaxID=1961666 RepID=UPI0009805A99|nr:capsid protein [Qinghai Himalayan marmot astrovirus 2]AQM49973.1 capsid protein [Qinghai Himalayan marmot astrovirus 2]
MANGQSPKTTKMQPVPQGTGNRRRRRNPKNKTKNKKPQLQRTTNVKRAARAAAKREIHRLGLSGPKVAVSQTVTATLGTIGANQGNKVELELAALLNPALVKETSGSNAFGPIQALAAQFGLWRCTQAHLKFTPLVGASAISGTAIRASLNLTATPGSTSWSGLGARVHKDVNVGSSGVFHLARKQLAGPRESWWLTNTNDDKTQSLGPAIEVHSLGKTTSTYQNSDYTGSLFLVELRATWEFANYLTQPSLASLAKTEAPAASVTINAAEPGQPITMTVAEGSAADALARIAPLPSTAARAGGTVGEVIVQVVDASVSVAAGALPPPFGWLIAGGWWFVKRVAGLGRAGEVVFQIYASAEDAAANRPCIADGTSSAVVLPGVVAFNQINTPNTGVSGTPATSARGLTHTPQPGLPFVVDAAITSQQMSVGTVPGTLNALVVSESGSWGNFIQFGSDTNYRVAVNGMWTLPDIHAWDVHGDVVVPPGFGASTATLWLNDRQTGATLVGISTNSDTNATETAVENYFLWKIGSYSAATTSNQQFQSYILAPTSEGSNPPVLYRIYGDRGAMKYPAYQGGFLLTMFYGCQGPTYVTTTGSTSLQVSMPNRTLPVNSHYSLRYGPAGNGTPRRLSLEMVYPGTGPWSLAPSSTVVRSMDLDTVDYGASVSVDTSSDTDYDTDTGSDTSDSEPEDFVDWAFQMSAKYTIGDDSSAPLREKIGKLLVEEGVPADAAQRRAMLAAPTPAFQDFLHAHQEVLSDGFGSRRVIHSDLSDRAVDLGLSYLSSRGHAE